MPRGIPNAKRDETGMRYTTFNVPLSFNPKHVSSTYLKSESQTLWARNAAKKARTPGDEKQLDQRRGSQVIVIHPGSRYIRIGRASDVNPVTVPCVVARKSKTPLTPLQRVRLISWPRRLLKASAHDELLPQDDGEPDPFDAKLANITLSLRDRMRFYKLRVTPNATKIASTFNEQFRPEKIAEHNDYETEWIDGLATEETFIGEKALRIIDPDASNYVVRWPIHGHHFNTKDYNSLQMILSDLEAIIEETLREKLNINRADYKNFSVMLVIPDYYDRLYVRELVNLLMVSMCFKQICAQQESLSATYGAGISNACVVDIGATITTIACVDEGLVLPETRMTLNTGGDDITEFLYVLLDRIKFPYREIDLNKSYDWQVMEELKCKFCSLNDSDVALNLWDFNVRRPNRLTEKYGIRTYDETILAPMCLFEPRIIEFDHKRNNYRPISQSVTEEIMAHQNDYVTNAMVISTQHLIPHPSSTEPILPPQPPIPADHPPDNISLTKAEGDAQPMNVDSNSTGQGIQETPIEVVDVEDEGRSTAPQPQIASLPSHNQSSNNTNNPADQSGSYAIDVFFEASKLPLDVAIFNSARSAGGEDKIRKYLQAVLVIGGSALVTGMSHALESRLQAIATPLVQNMEKVQIIPPPKEVDPRVLAWKGAAVLSKMESISELWVSPSDWDFFGMRALKERCFYL